MCIRDRLYPLLLTKFLLIQNSICNQRDNFLNHPYQIVLFNHIFSYSLNIFHSDCKITNILLIFTLLDELFFLSLTLPSLLSLSLIHIYHLIPNGRKTSVTWCYYHYRTQYGWRCIGCSPVLFCSCTRGFDRYFLLPAYQLEKCDGQKWKDLSLIHI